MAAEECRSRSGSILAIVAAIGVICNIADAEVGTMGISYHDIDLLIRLKSAGEIPNGGAVAEIGAQQLGASFLASTDELGALGRLFGKTKDLELPAPPLARIAHGDLIHLEKSAPLARQFWEWLGLKYFAVDIDGNESIQIDLNFDAVPAAHCGRFDLVTNYGTTEHVANQLNAFKVIHDLTRVGGVMIHHVPLQGMISHGLVNYNPKFFWTLARSNRYEWMYFNLLISTVHCELPPDVIGDVNAFDPGILERARNYHTSDLMALVAVKKVQDIPFVPPIDVNTGAQSDNKQLQERYWTVFKPSSSTRGSIGSTMRRIAGRLSRTLALRS
jgi:hypothetical protein